MRLFVWDLEFAVTEGAFIGLQVAPSYQFAAQKVAKRIAANAKALVGADSPSAAEVTTFISTKVARAWRRPLNDSEIAALS